MEKEDKKKNPVSGWEARLPDEGKPFAYKCSRWGREVQEEEDKILKENTVDPKEDLLRISTPLLEDRCGHTPYPIEIVFGYKELSSEKKINYGNLRSYAWDGLVTFVSAKQQAKDLGYKDHTSIYYHLQALEKAGLIERIYKYKHNRYGKREGYERTDIRLLPIDPKQTALVNEKLNIREKGDGNLSFQFKNINKISSSLNVNNVLFRGYRDLPAGAKLLFIALCYIAQNKLRLTRAVIASMLGKELSFVKRNLKELIKHELIEKKKKPKSPGRKVSDDDKINVYLINDFKKDEVFEYIKLYKKVQYLNKEKDDTQHMVGGRSSVDPVDNNKAGGRSSVDPVDNQHMVGGRSSVDPISGADLQLTGGHIFSHKNITLIEKNVSDAFIKNASDKDAYNKLDEKSLNENHLDAADRIAGKLGDRESIRWHYKVAKLFFEKEGTYYTLERLASEAKHKSRKGELKNSAGAYFTGAVKKIAKEKGVRL